MTRFVALLITIGVLSAQAGAQQLAPTTHPPVPRALAQMWLVPANPARPGSTPLAAALRFVDDEDYVTAVPLLAAAAGQRGLLADYAIYYVGAAELALGRPEAARDRFRTLAERQPSGYLSEAAALGEAEAHIALDAPEKAVAIYERLTTLKTAAPDDVLMRLAGAAKAAGDDQKAGEALARVYFEFPQSRSAAEAATEYNAMSGVQRLAAGNQRYKLELGRAQRLARRKAVGPGAHRVRAAAAVCGRRRSRAREPSPCRVRLLPAPRIAPAADGAEALLGTRVASGRSAVLLRRRVARLGVTPSTSTVPGASSTSSRPRAGPKKR